MVCTVQILKIMKEINIQQIDWNKNPAKFKVDMNENFMVMKKAYELLAEKVIEKVTNIKSENENIKIYPPETFGNHFSVKLSESIVVEKIKSDLVSSKQISSEKISSNVFEVEKSIYIDKDIVSFGNLIHFDVNSNNLNIGAKPENESSTYKRTKLRIVPESSLPAHHSIVIQKPTELNYVQFSDENVDFVIKGDGNIGIGKFYDLSSKLTINSNSGFDQICLKSKFTPTDSKKNGEIGNIAWDDNFIYVKTSDGWKKSQLQAI
jgi:hypothetical protein